MEVSIASDRVKSSVPAQHVSRGAKDFAKQQRVALRDLAPSECFGRAIRDLCELIRVVSSGYKGDHAEQSQRTMYDRWMF